MSSIEAAERYDRHVGELVSYYETSGHLVPETEIIDLHIRAMGLYAQAAEHLNQVDGELSV